MSKRARRRSPKALFREMVERCPYRTLLGRGTDPTEMMGRLGCTIAVIGGTPEPLSQRMMADALAVLQSDGIALLISDDRTLRDYAKRDVLQMAGPAGGAA